MLCFKNLKGRMVVPRYLLTFFPFQPTLSPPPFPSLKVFRDASPSQAKLVAAAMKNANKLLASQKSRRPFPNKEGRKKKKEEGGGDKPPSQDFFFFLYGEEGKRVGRGEKEAW